MDELLDEAARERLRRATDELEPSAGFAARVVGALDPPAPPWLVAVSQLGRRALPVMFLAAALSIAIAAVSHTRLEAALRERAASAEPAP